MTATAPLAASEDQVVAQFDVRLRRERGFRFRVDFDKEEHPPLWLDEPPPLGKDTGPNAARLLAAAIGDCLAASLLFSLGKAGVDVESLDGYVSVQLVRNADRRLRIGKLHVRLDPKIAAQHHAALERSIASFEDFCVVTQSVRAGIDVSVEVAR